MIVTFVTKGPRLVVPRRSGVVTAYERASVHEKDLRVMLALINRFPNSMDTEAAV